MTRQASRIRVLAFARLLMLCACLLGLGACSGVPVDRYGIDEVEIVGAEQLDDDALEACLATQPREAAITLNLGMSLPPSCGSPPFDSHVPRVRLWIWPWTEWNLFDLVVFERDLERVVRWYHARGYYDAEVVDWRVEPESAMDSDTVRGDTQCDREGSDEGCTVRVVIEVHEGEPTLVSEMRLEGVDGLPKELRARIREEVPFRVGDRFDEALYESAKEWLRTALSEESYARAEVSGRVVVDRQQREASVTITVDAGPRCRFGELTVEGAQGFTEEVIEDAAIITPGQPYSDTAIVSAQAAIYDLGAFAAVNVVPEVPEDGDVVPITIQVRHAEQTRFQLGGGIQSGSAQNPTGNTTEAVPQWDVHLLSSWEHRNFLGGLRKLRLEDRPRLVFPDAFPTATDPRFGNVARVTFRQPGVFEPRTHLTFETTWDYGPDRFVDIQRHQVDMGLSLERFFARRRLHVRAGIYESIYRVPDPDSRTFDGTVVPADSELTYLGQEFVLDLRNDSLRTTGGIHLRVETQEAGFFLPSSWDYFRVSGELHTFAPLFAGIVLVNRIKLGGMFIDHAVQSVDDLSQELGPTSQRLRGGGGTDHRGFRPGDLGDGSEGGIRHWLASAELRFPLTRSFFITTFLDAGDVSRTEGLRFDHPQIAVGGGIRFLTIIGAITLDVGWRVPDWQVLADEDERVEQPPSIFGGFDGAINLTLGSSL
ncbi:MAG: BamA/TamA family outer membrane protein [Myxococcales bacterium]|nr:BamA/TamA family outer membrane protein [Myxococcales bacterium]